MNSFYFPVKPWSIPKFLVLFHYSHLISLSMAFSNFGSIFSLRFLFSVFRYVLFFEKLRNRIPLIPFPFSSITTIFQYPTFIWLLPAFPSQLFCKYFPVFVVDLKYNQCQCKSSLCLIQIVRSKIVTPVFIAKPRFMWCIRETISFHVDVAKCNESILKNFALLINWLYNFTRTGNINVLSRLSWWHNFLNVHFR